jgi:hypothetical protein
MYSEQHKIYDSICGSIKAENWDAVWGDSFQLDNGHRIRKQMRCVNGECSPIRHPSIVEKAASEAFSGCW